MSFAGSVPAVFPTTVARAASPVYNRVPRLATLRSIHYQRVDAWQWDLWYKLQNSIISIATIAADFATIASLGINCIRLSVHAGTSGQGSNAFNCGGAGPTAGQLASLTAVLAAARDAGLQVWINAFDHYNGWVVADMAAWMTAIVGAFPANHTVVVFEYQNEVSSGMTNPAGFAAAIQALAPLGRAILPAGTLTTISITDTPNSNQEGYKDGTGRMRYLVGTLLGGSVTLLDFIALHIYPYARNEYWPQMLPGNLAICAPLPIYIGETGVSTNYMDLGYNNSPTNAPNFRLAKEAADEYCWRAGAYLLRSLGLGDPLRWAWTDLRGIGDYGAAGSQIPVSTIPAPTQAAGASAFALGDVVKINYAWRNSYGTTTPQAASQQSITIGASGNTITLPAMQPPAQAIGLDIYVSISNGSSTLTLAASQAVVSDQLLTTPIVLSAYGASGAQAIPSASPNTTQAQTTNISNPGANQVYGREYGYGLARTPDEGGGGLKAGALGMQSVWLLTAALSTDSNLGFESAAVPDFAGVVQWPSLWRRYQGNSHLATQVVSTLGAPRPGSTGTQSLQLSGVSSDGTASFSGVFQAPIQPSLKTTNTVTVSGYVNVSALPAGMTVSVLVAWLDNTNTQRSTTLIYSTGSTTAGWVSFTGSPHPPAGAGAFYIYLRLDPGVITVPGGVVNFDDLAVTIA